MLREDLSSRQCVSRARSGGTHHEQPVDTRRTAVAVAILLSLLPLSAPAQTGPPRLTGTIDEARLVALSGNTRPEMNARQ